MIEDIQYRKYQPGDEEEIYALLQQSFPKWKNRTVEYWKWKYIQSPLGQYVYLALDGNRIIGTVCDLPFQIKVGEQTLQGIYSDDTTIDNNYRGRGIYSKLDKFTKESKKMEYFGYWETENPIVVKVAKQDPEQPRLFPYKIARMIKIKDLDKYLKKHDRDTLVNRLGYTVLKSSNTLTSITHSKDIDEQDYTIHTIKRFDDQADKFWERIRVEYNYTIEKKKDYLNWRYCTQNPEEYLIRSVAKGDTTLGFSVLRRREDEDGSEGTILDLITYKERQDIANNLLEDALTQFEKQGTNSVYFQTIRGHPYQKMASNKGFIDVSRASKMQIYYSIRNKPSFDHQTFSSYHPSTIYFNIY